MSNETVLNGGYFILNVQNGIEYDATAADGQMRKTASNGKLKQLHSATPVQFTPFEQAIKQSCDWFCDNFDKARK